MKRNKIFIPILLMLLTISSAFGQLQLSVPNDPAGDLALKRSGIMAANRVLLLVNNTTELGDRTDMNPSQISYWPNDYNGTGSHDCIWLEVGARVFVDTSKSPDDPGYVIESLEEVYSSGITTIDTIFYIQTYTREGAHDAPITGGIQWGFYPTKGYMNEAQAADDEIPAMADKIGTFRYKDSWPTAGWPAVSNGRDTLIYIDEEGNVGWNGRFGYNVYKADLECYFVANDAQDLEYILDDHPINSYYYPRGKDFKIGSIDPNNTTQNGQPWGGIGVRSAVRGYQWTNPQAQDAIFFEFNITNISNYTLPDVFFGFEVDNAVGGESADGADDVAFYKKENEVNLTFVWDYDFIPSGGGKEPGVIGFAFLESPGLNRNGIDDDGDGIIDEQRDNTTTASSQKVHYTQIVQDIAAYKTYFDFSDLSEEEFINAINGEYHYAEDEDLDWRPYGDDNGNGQWDFGEPINDDVGTDGLDPYDLTFYRGPDANGTEGNGRPDCIVGLGSEPNFGTTDVNETDQLGLQNFNYICSAMPVYTSWGWLYGPGNDENSFRMHYDGITSTTEEEKFDRSMDQPLNFHMAFSSGMFVMEPGVTERISLAELHAYDPLAGLRGTDNPQAPALFRLTEVVNKIYEADYRFAQPPMMPELTAIPGDGKVTLTWDNSAELYTREVMDQNNNDFEGYKIYRATDKQMSDPNLITDLNGNFIFKKAIFQCDKIDGIYGAADFGLVNGTGYYLGEDTGITHTFVDTTAKNGVTYYYAIVAYDYGLPKLGDGVSPSENIIVIEKDAAENIVATSRNVAIVTPYKKAAGYVPPGIENFVDETFGTGYVFPEIISNDEVKGGSDYKIRFLTNTYTLDNVKDAMRYWTKGLEVYRDNGNTPVYVEKFQTDNDFRSGNVVPYLDDYAFRKGKEVTTEIFDGLYLKIYLPTIEPKIDTLESAWRTGDGTIDLRSPLNGDCYLPYDYEIIFGDVSGTVVSGGEVRDYTGKIIPSGNLIFNADLPFYVQNRSLNGAKTVLVVFDKNGNGSYDFKSDIVLAGAPTDDGSSWGTLAFEIDFTGRSAMPSAGDSYFVTFYRGFSHSDDITFMVKEGETFNKKTVKEDLNKIKVVPNPYICTNEMEPSVMNLNFNQRRRIIFTNVPAQCTIKIFTLSGLLVDELKVDHSAANSDAIYSDYDDNGTAIWDVLTHEGLEVAAGYYIYQVKSNITGDEKIGKFAIIK
ncbi:MAG: hypothetical protein JXQ65_10610 [Candidatus Marinimicrobia bacterium]|nr:hypothetical protein [Candidatus Neomarinimicrobiota bacterium]